MSAHYVDVVVEQDAGFTFVNLAPAKKDLRATRFFNAEVSIETDPFNPTEILGYKILEVVPDEAPKEKK